MTRVVTYRLCYQPAYGNLTVDLCPDCAGRDDHDCGALGQVEHGLHSGHCDGALHGQLERRDRNEERLTWGFLPLERHFRQAFDEDLGQDGIYKIRNCRELEAVYQDGNVDFNQDELWQFLSECEQQGWDTNHELSDLVSGILLTLGFDWV